MIIKTRFTQIGLCDSIPGLDLNRHSWIEFHVWFESQMDKFNLIWLENKIPSRGLNLTIKIILQYH